MSSEPRCPVCGRKLSKPIHDKCVPAKPKAKKAKKNKK